MALLALFLSFASFSFLNLVTRPIACFPGDIGTTKCPISVAPTFAFGTWVNMPSSTSCSTTDTSQPVCELFGNQSYRNVLRVFSNAKYLLGLEVGCTTPSNHATAQLQLQYANASATTHLNTTKFVNAGSAGVNQVFVDNSANWACPGTLHTTTYAFTLPVFSAGVETVFMLRVVGLNGGGAGDLPRFSNINVLVSTQLTNQIVGYAQSISTTGFTALMASNLVATSALSVNFVWTATDGTTTQDGTGTCAIPAKQTQCSQVITFAPAFVGTPGVSVTNTDGPILKTIFAGEIPLFATQTVTA